ncbi:unnamed protein product [Ceratitis capitata]|uniref:(Mediterranean fruit fly) hypothetical protein n=1 Tax=Ceratitis capitata TaxID=7213 RepID=A0A811UTQ7_CERCA|nr:unnamed protein product [Ceratitis capitata]
MNIFISELNSPMAILKTSSLIGIVGSKEFSSSTCTPYYALFGQHMVTHAQDYELLRKLDDFDSSVLEKSDRLKLIRDSIGRNIKQHLKYQPKDIICVVVPKRTK